MTSTSTSAARPSIAQPPQGPPINQHRSRRVTTSISPAHIAAVKAASPIVDVIGQHVDLRRQGKNFAGSCLWHTSRSGRSFVVNPEYGTCTCWAGCISGDVFAFVRKLFNFSFPDAVAHLARRAGIDITKAPSRELEVRVAQQTELARINQELRTAEKSELRRLSSELSDARRLYRAAAARLMAIADGAPIRFSDEQETCWEAMRLAGEEIRDAEVAYAIVAFGSQQQREVWLQSPEGREEMVHAALAQGYVKDAKGIRHQVIAA